MKMNRQRVNLPIKKIHSDFTKSTKTHMAEWFKFEQVWSFAGVSVATASNLQNPSSKFRA